MISADPSGQNGSGKIGVSMTLMARKPALTTSSLS
jgi:hypothetical protein